MNTDVYIEKEKQSVRLQYNSPIFEEYGELSELTHGFTGPREDGGGELYAFPAA